MHRITPGMSRRSSDDYVIKISQCSNGTVNGDYKMFDAATKDTSSISFHSTCLTANHIYGHVSQPYLLFHIDFELPFQHPSDPQTPLSLWILCKHDSYKITKFILARAPRISAIDPHIPPKSKYIDITPVNIDDKDASINEIMTEILNVTTESKAICIQTKGSKYHSVDDSLDASDNILDPNVRICCINDIRKYSQYHSWYKHLPYPGLGHEHIMLPKLYGQVRGYHEQKRKLGQIRWHPTSIARIKKDGDSVFEKINKWYPDKYDPKIIEILMKYPFKFNCCLWRGQGYVTAAEEYIRKKYPYLTQGIPKREQISYHDRDQWNAVSIEESDDQIEFAALQTFRAYDEICEMLKEKRKLMVDGYIRIEAIDEHFPKEVGMIVANYVAITMTLPDNYKDN